MGVGLQFLNFWITDCISHLISLSQVKCNLRIIRFYFKYWQGVNVYNTISNQHLSYLTIYGRSWNFERPNYDILTEITLKSLKGSLLSAQMEVSWCLGSLPSGRRWKLKNKYCKQKWSKLICRIFYHLLFYHCNTDYWSLFAVRS